MVGAVAWVVMSWVDAGSVGGICSEHAVIPKHSARARSIAKSFLFIDVPPVFWDSVIVNNSLGRKCPISTKESDGAEMLHGLLYPYGRKRKTSARKEKYI